MLICFLRVMIIYPIVIFGIRLMGKRQIGELQPTELVVAMLISNTATLPLEDQQLPLPMGIIPMLMLICFEVLLSWGTLRSRPLRKLLLGSPQIIIRNGVIEQQVMRALRSLGIFDVNEVLLAIVETNGAISAYQKAKYRNVTCEDMKLNPKDELPPEVLIADGCISQQGMESVGFTRARLDGILTQQDMDISEIFLLTADRQGIKTLVRKNEVLAGKEQKA